MISMGGKVKNEQGMVSILVTMIMIVVITLIVLGFAQVSRRNQREALDDQLSAQAYYAAESGVDAAIDYLSAHTGYQKDTVGNGQCGTFISTLGNTNVLDQPTNTEYTCLMVDTEPSDLNISPLTQQSNTILHLANTDTEPFTALKFTWSPQNPLGFPAGTCSGSGVNGTTLPAYASWKCPYGLLRLDLVDTSSAAITNANVESGQDAMSFYFIPSYQPAGGTFKNTAKITWPPTAQAVDPTQPYNSCNGNTSGCPVQVIPVHCANPTTPTNGNCSIELDLYNAAGVLGGSTDYYGRMSMMYQDSSSVVITGGDNTNPITPSGGGVQFIGGQALIDSTGQSGDELRRVQVRVPIAASSGDLPLDGLQTTDTLCKQLSDGPLPLSTQDTCPDHP
jgi:hypothetical protein